MKKTKKQELFIDLIAAIDATKNDSRMYQANNIIHLNDQNHSVHTTLVHNT
jgi:hypothetical protein